MENKKKKMFIFVIVFIMVSVWSVGYIYLHQLEHATEDMTRVTIEELAAHDSESIQSKVEGYWKELDGVYARMLRSSVTTIQDVCSRLNIEGDSGVYTTIFLVDDEGNTYSGTHQIINQAKNQHVKKLLNGEERIALNYEYEENEQSESWKEVLAVGSRQENFTVEGVNFIGIIGFIELKQLVNELEVECFSGSGKATVIDYDGYYIVNSERNEGIAKRENYFEKLQKKCKSPKEHLEKICKKINSGQPFYDKVECSGTPGGEVVYYSALENVDWIMMITVPQTVIAKVSQRFVKITGIMFLAFLGILILGVVVCLRLFLESVNVKATSKARSEFLSVMSHEIRTPLNGLIGLNYLMQNHIGEGKKMEEYLLKSNATAQYLLSLINDILDLSKLQAGKMEFFEQPCSIQFMISTIESMLRSKMENKKICFQIEEEIIQDMIVGDDTRIKQVLINIIGNACKFTQEGGHVKVRVTQRIVDEKHVETTYEVSDNGCGMTEEFQNHIFDSFTQENRNTPKKTNGTGLGMAISAMLAQQMDGTLSVKSQEGEGSTFTFVLVSEISDATPDMVVIKNAHREKRVLEKDLHILVAEDQDLNAEILIELLEEEGFCVDRASDGETAVELFEQSELYAYDLILMDVQMPKQNGYDAAKNIRRLPREDAQSVIIYACTANAFKEDLDMALKSGMNDFVTKPINIEKLMKKLDTDFFGGGELEDEYE